MFWKDHLKVCLKRRSQCYPASNFSLLIILLNQQNHEETRLACFCDLVRFGITGRMAYFITNLSVQAVGGDFQMTNFASLVGLLVLFGGVFSKCDRIFVWLLKNSKTHKNKMTTLYDLAVEDIQHECKKTE